MANQKSKITSSSSFSKKEQQFFRVNDVVNLNISALGPNNVGLAELANGYTVVVPKANLGDSVKVQIQKILNTKTKYATAKLLETIKVAKETNLPVVGETIKVSIEKEGPQGSGLATLNNSFTVIVPKAKVGSEMFVKLTRIKSDYAFATIVNSSANANSKTLENLNNSNELNVVLGSKFNVILPKSGKMYSDYLILKIRNSVVFVKLALGAKLGDTVQIKVTKMGEAGKFAVARILKVSPLTKMERQQMVKSTVKKMVQTGLHFGEKAIRCHANMRKFIWKDKKGTNQNRPLLKRGRHLINVLKTRSCLSKALKQLAKYAAKGKTFLFVGTKKSASALMARTAMLTKTSFFVNTRWLGGMLTNWKTILKSISQIQPILKEKQKIIKNILEKRQKMKKRLVKKVNLLRKQSQKLMTKGKMLITKIRQNKNNFIEKSEQLLSKKDILLQNNQLLVQKYTELNSKKNSFLQRGLQFQQKGNMFVAQKQSILKELSNNQLKLKEFTQLFQIGQELLNLKNAKTDAGNAVWTLSYAKLSTLAKANDQTWVIPNPPKQILNQMINSMKMEYNVNVENSVNTSNRPQSAETTTNVIVVSKLLNKFTRFLPFMKLYISALVLRIKNNQVLLKTCSENIQTIKDQLNNLVTLNTKVNTELQLIETKLKAERENIQILKTKLRRLASEQRLLKFLPRLRYLPTPKTKMSETIQILMKKFVDPKMSYPMDQIYDSKLKFTTKKVAAARKQKWQRLEKYFGGVTKMAKMNKKQIKNNVAIIVGQQEEMNAVRECRKLNIKMFTLVDTNCNPQLSDHVIPANDDSRNAIKFVLGEILTHIRLAQKLRQKIVSKRIQKYSVKK